LLFFSHGSDINGVLDCIRAAFVELPGSQGALNHRLQNSGINPAIKGSLKNNFTFYTPLHPVWLRCESSEYPDIPALSRLARRAPQRLKL